MPTLGSLFDGSGGFPLAGQMCGVTPVWASEIEPYPIAVTRSRFPDMKHLGSVTEVNGAEVQPVDIITFGSPCQDMSVAGARAGMKHTEHGADETTRSGLFYEAIRIIEEMRKATNGMYPTFAVWENVPGAFSSNNGEDFRCVLQAFSDICGGGAVPKPEKWGHAGEIVGDGFSVAWRLFDAQYWGVPQRRKRIYLVADFGGERAGKILFERESLSGDSAESGAAGEGTARNAEGSTGRSVRYAVGFDAFNGALTGETVQNTLRVHCGLTDGGNGVITMASGQANAEIEVDNSVTLTCQHEQPILSFAQSAQYGQYSTDNPQLRASGGDIGGAVKR